MKRWAIGGAIAAVVILVIAFGSVELLGPRAEVQRAPVVATAPATTPAETHVATGEPTATSAPAVTSTWGVSAANAAELASATPTIKVSAPIAVRSRHPFAVTGSIKSSSADETVTVRLERRVGSSWTDDAVATVALSPQRTFAIALTAPHGGDLRVVATIPADSQHLAGSGQALLHGVGPKVIALTFDDGPWPSSTQAIVNTLAANNVHATFFELGSQVRGRPALSKTVSKGGNIIGVHTWNHAMMTKRSAAVNRNDLLKTKNTISKATGVTPAWFRPPYGSTNKSVAAAGRSVGLGQVLWSVDTLDWKYRNTPSIVSRALRGSRSGAIILMHDGGGPRKATANAVPIIIKRLRAQGYDLVTLDEMKALGYPVR